MINGIRTNVVTVISPAVILMNDKFVIGAYVNRLQIKNMPLYVAILSQAPALSSHRSALVFIYFVPSFAYPQLILFE
jgi:hypothetical protein